MLVSAPSFSRGATNDPPSGVAYAFCEDFNPTEVNFEVSVQPNSAPGQSTKPALTATFNSVTADKKDKKALSRSISQLLGVKDVQVTSTSMSEICFESLVAGLNIIIDKKTLLKKSCGTTSTSSQTTEPPVPCKTFGSKLEPQFVCHQAITLLLKERGIISKSAVVPNPPAPGKLPTYDITQDMINANLAIADGVVDIGRKIKKHRANSNLAKLPSAGSKKWNSFLKGLAPVLNSFGGLAAIMTTFFTPNPFDELAKYIKEQFSIVQQQLNGIKRDIENLQRVVEGQSQKIIMANALRNIRHMTRRYNRMLETLSQSKKCMDPTKLLGQSVVQQFMSAADRKDLRDNLRDLLEVDFGGVVEASGLLRPLMRAYCKSNPARVNRFMKHVAMYAYGGTIALFAYDNLQCKKNNIQSFTCREDNKLKLLKKLYKFTQKAKIYEVASGGKPESLMNGFLLDTRDDFEKLILGELDKTPKPSPPFPGLFDKVKKLITDKLTNAHDWPYACMMQPISDNRKLVILGIAQIDSNVFGTRFVPWALFNKGTVQNSYFQTQPIPSGYSKKNFRTYISEVYRVRDKNRGSEAYMEYSNTNKGFIARPWQLNNVPPSKPTDLVMYFLFNPKNFQTKSGTQKLVGNTVPVDAYFLPKKYMKWGPNVDKPMPNPTIACWLASKGSSRGWPNEYRCQAPNPNNPDQAKPNNERYVAIVGE